MGLIIDLTNSWRYYDLEEVHSLGVEHRKIMCKGRGKVSLPLPASYCAYHPFSAGIGRCTALTCPDRARPITLKGRIIAPLGCLYLCESHSAMQAPEPQAVNQFVWELMNFNRTNSGKWAVVHCTHGYNRTGGSSACASLRGPVGKTVWCSLHKRTCGAPMCAAFKHAHGQPTPVVHAKATPTRHNVARSLLADSAV